jgi:DNA-binding MarR family transcriptional regulator
MADVKSGANLLFLREEELRQGIELLYYAYRDFTAGPDEMLAKYGFGRAHHRVIYFVGRHPQMSVTDLLGILRITKQSLARVLNALVEQGFVAQAPGRSDRRQRLLTLAPAGAALERRLFESQRKRLSAAFGEAGGAAVDGFRRVMRCIMDQTARAYIDIHDIDPTAQSGRAARGRPA